jgi:hypothetical protein
MGRGKGKKYTSFKLKVRIQNNDIIAIARAAYLAAVETVAEDIAVWLGGVA